MHPLLLAPHVDRLIAADSVQPFHKMTVEFGPVLSPQLEKRLLHHVAGMFFVADDPPRVPEQSPLETHEDSLHPLGFDRVSVIHPRVTRSTASVKLDASRGGGIRQK